LFGKNELLKNKESLKIALRDRRNEDGRNKICGGG